MIEFAMDWYPEHWDPSIWADDCKRMKDLGIDAVRIGEFAWSRMEPEEGRFEFDWLDQAIDTAKKAGLKIILGTPTNTPPIWMFKNYPETLRVDKNGNRISYGLRGHRCMSSPVQRMYSKRIIEEMTKRYAKDPDVIGWQIDNELEANGCTCETCTKEFVNWLKDKYGTLENLNRAWKDDVWSGEISDWDQITLLQSGGRKPDWYNPAYMLDKERWKADSLTDYIKFQADLIREANPDAVITTNSCMTREIPGYHDQSKVLDVAAYDNYPPNRIPDLPVEEYSNAMVLDYIRGFKRKNFWVLEQLAAPMGCWDEISPALEPGMIEGYALQAIAHGADLLSFFRWRTASGGAEMFCYGLLDHDNRDNRRVKELRHLIERVNALPADLSETEIKSPVAILYGRDQEVSFKNQSQGFDYWKQIKAIHGACMQLGVNADIINQDENLEGYEIVFVPSLFVEARGLDERLETFAENGGTVIFTIRSGAKDENGNVFAFIPQPGPYAKLCGMDIIESDAQAMKNQTIRSAEGKTYPSLAWNDLIHPDSAKVYAVHQDRFYEGEAAITINEIGKGQVWYIGVLSDKSLYKDILEEILIDKGIGYYPGLPDGIEAVSRSGKEHRFDFIFNNTMESKTFLLNGEETTLEPLEMKILVDGKPEGAAAV